MSSHSSSTTEIPLFAKRYPNIASPKYGTVAVQASDEFFAAKERLISDAAPVFIPEKYDDHGKWMDGWESRRRRDGGYDWCILKLGVPCRINGVEIDTSHFTGNFPPYASVELCPIGADPGNASSWNTLLAKTALHGDRKNYFEAECAGGPWQWARLNIFPDGGVARLRLYGTVDPLWDDSAEDEAVELSALKSGGKIIAYNDAHYGDVSALLTEGRGTSMGDGWETRRRREPGHDWIIIALGAKGKVSSIELDTAYFKGNFPDGASVQAADCSGMTREGLIEQSEKWPEVLRKQKLRADEVHKFGEQEISATHPVTHVRLNIYPDGGVSRFRVFGCRVK